MAEDFFSTNPEDSIKHSRFNEAFLKMQRLDKIQDKLNQLRMNPLEISHDLNLGRVYNYEIIFSCIKSLYMEIVGKLSSKDDEDIHSLISLIGLGLKNDPPFKKNPYLSSEKRIIFDKDSWDKISDLLEDAEIKLRKLMDKHGLSTPDEEEEEGF